MLRKKLGFVLLPLAVAAIYNSWFLSLGVRTSGDWGFLLQTTSDTLRRFYFTTWLSDNQFGRVLIDAGQAPTYAMYGWLTHYLHSGYALNERLVHMWPAVIVAIIAPYCLVKYIYNDKVAGALGAIVYSANTYYLALLTGHLTLAVAYAFAPLVVLFYLKTINHKRTADILACALVFAVCGAYEPRSAYIIAIVLILLAAYHFFFILLPRHRLTLRLVLTMGWVYSGPLIIFGLLNAYWVLGLAFAGGGGNGTFSTSLFGNEFFTISEALTLFHPFWSGGQIKPFVVHTIPIYFWLIPLAAASALVLIKRNKTLFFFALLGVIGILLAKQSDEPFTTLYHWLFVTVPGFNAFREASKFYMIIAIAYAVLIPGLYWYAKKRYPAKKTTLLLFAGLALLFLPNLKPIVTNEIGATFLPRSMPKEYVTLNSFLDTPEYNRVLWVPEKPRWGLANATHPPVTPVKLLGESWKSLAASNPSNNNGTVADEVGTLLRQDYMPQMLASAGIRYVIVPMRDLQNADNFYRNYGDDPSVFTRILSDVGYLKETKLHLKGFAIYETIQPSKPYFSSLSDVYSIQDAHDLPAIYDFWHRAAGKQQAFDFILGDKTTNFTTDIRDLFGQYGAADIHAGTIPALQAKSNKPDMTYYFDQNYGEISYKASRETLTFGFNSLDVPGTSGAQHKTSSVAVPLAKTQEYVLENEDTISRVNRSSRTVYLGSPRSNTRLYEVMPQDLVPPPTIKDSLWQEEVEDCVPYGQSAPRMSMSSEADSKLKKPVLALYADDHAACTGPPAIPVSSGTYLLRFRYRGMAAQLLSYQLTYTTPGQIERLVKDIPLTDDGWHTHTSLIHIPPGATQLQVRLIGRPSNQSKLHASARFTDLSLLHVNQVADFKTATGNIQKTDIPPASLNNYRQKGYNYHNLIPNGSFETGLWKKRVGDCNAYDSKPAIKMSITHKASVGHNALRLEAKRHIACTSADNIQVQGGASYLLQFDYQSPNASTASYTITLDDKNVTRIEQSIPITDTRWHTYKRIVTLPIDAQHINVAVSAHSDEDNQTNFLVNNYDNFTLQQVPDVTNRFYSIAAPGAHLGTPRTITYQTVSHTLKKVTITTTDAPFVLLMSEQYHPGWQLVAGRQVPVVPSSDHLAVNGFENAWYVRPQQICQTHASICTRHADGSYTLHLAVQFSAERWFDRGLLISVSTAIATVLALLFLSIKQWIGKTEEHHGTTRRRA